jgi:FAD:protein FMN transferase
MLSAKMDEMMLAAAHVRNFLPARLLLAALLAAPAIAAPPTATVLTGRTMGTTYRLKYWGAGEAPTQEMQRAVDRLLTDIDRQMSTYRDDSELSRFNRAPAGEWFDVSAATANVVAQAIELHRRTGGVYDVTIGPALRLWNFGPGESRRHDLSLPTEQQLAMVRKVVGAQLLDVRLDPPALRKEIDGLEVDLSSLAPGYAVDLIIDLLADAGFANAIVEVGGEVRAAGVNPDGDAWRVGVEEPGTDPARMSQVVPLRDLALSTSGDYRNFRVIDGERYAHILDARTLRPLPYRRMSVTVLAATCAEADALGTALLIMGPEAGREWCLEHDVAAMFQFRADGSSDDDRSASIEQAMTPQFRRSLLPEGTSVNR